MLGPDIGYAVPSMGVTFEVHETEAYFVSRWQGRTDPDEVRKAYEQFFDGGQWKPNLDELADLSEADVAGIATDEIKDSAQQSGDLYAGRGVTSTRTAVYAPSKLAFGLLRVHQAWADGSPERVEVFSDLEEARRWLRSKEPTRK